MDFTMDLRKIEVDCEESKDLDTRYLTAEEKAEGNFSVTACTSIF
jgi:hypothetical protein